MRNVQIEVHDSGDPPTSDESPYGLAGEARQRRRISHGAFLSYHGPVAEEAGAEDRRRHRFMLELSEGAEIEDVAEFLVDRLRGRVAGILVERQEVVLELEPLTTLLEAEMGTHFTDPDGREWQVTLESLGLTTDVMAEFEKSGAQLPHHAAQIVFRSGSETLTDEYTAMTPVVDLDDDDLEEWFHAARKRHEYELDHAAEEQADRDREEREIDRRTAERPSPPTV